MDAIRTSGKERMVGVAGGLIVRERQGCTEAETGSLVKIQVSKAGSKVGGRYRGWTAWDMAYGNKLTTIL